MQHNKYIKKIKKDGYCIVKHFLNDIFFETLKKNTKLYTQWVCLNRYT